MFEFMFVCVFKHACSCICTLLDFYQRLHWPSHSALCKKAEPILVDLPFVLSCTSPSIPYADLFKGLCRPSIFLLFFQLRYSAIHHRSRERNGPTIRISFSNRDPSFFPPCDARMECSHAIFFRVVVFTACLIM